MAPQVYNPDHTAHIHRRLVQMTVHRVVGLALASAAAGILAVLDTSAGDSWPTVTRAA